LDFSLALKVTILGQDLIRNMCGKFGVDPVRNLKKKFKMYQPIRGQGSHIGFQIGLKSNNTWSGPHKEHMRQVWSRSVQPFLRRSRKCVSKSEARVAILDFGSTLKVTTRGQDLIRNICGKLGVYPFSHS